MFPLLTFAAAGKRMLPESTSRKPMTTIQNDSNELSGKSARLGGMDILINNVGGSKRPSHPKQDINGNSPVRFKKDF
jgi:hypothetical protein